jgi:hypothetical protein
MADKGILEKAAVLGLTVPAGLMGGEMISDAMEGQLTKAERNVKRDEDVKRLKEKYDSKGPSGSGKESLSKERSYKKGGSVSSASKRADGCCVKGKTKGRMV